jgi:hypothetical protein
VVAKQLYFKKKKKFLSRFKRHLSAWDAAKIKKKIIWRSRPEVHKVAEPEQMAPLSIHKSKTVLD